VFVEVKVGEHLGDGFAGLHGVVGGEGDDLEFSVCLEALNAWRGTHMCDCFWGAHEFECPPKSC